MKRKAILLFCACLALSACGDDGRQVAKTELIREGDAPQIDAPAIEAPVVETPAQATEEVAPVAVEESEEEAAQEDVSFEDFFSREDRINTLLNLMQDSLEEGFGGNYFLSVEDNTIYASVWDDGVTTDAFLTTIRDGGETPQEWVTMQCHLVKQKINDIPTLSKMVGWVVHFMTYLTSCRFRYIRLMLVQQPWS